MKYQVLVENGTNDFYTATVVGIPNLQANATSEQEAITKVYQALLERLNQAKIVWLDVPNSTPEHPWMKYAGTLADNPLFDDVMKNIADYRRELDEDPDVV